jgi:hypothetical protein
MKNFKEIAEKCLAGELSGIFVTAFGNNWHSNYLQRHTILGHEMPSQYVLGPGVIYNEMGQCESREKVRIIDFIPDKMVQTKIEIDIPEGKVPVMERTEKGVFITWKEKEITYANVISKLVLNQNAIYEFWSDKIHEGESSTFYKKVEVLRKLTNIRNYFGKPKHNTYGHALYYTIERGIHATPALYPSNDQRVIFDTKEHAEQAIKMLGDELKYLFEPW